MAKRLDTKTWIILGLGGVTAVVGYALFSQWKHASLGRQIRRNVVRFLSDHGAVIRNGVMSGGVVREPMKVDTAVNATVVQMLNGVADQINTGGGGGRGGDDDENLGAATNPTTAMDDYATYASMPPPPHRSPRPPAAAKRSPAKSPRQQRKTAAGRAAGATQASPLEVSKTFKDDGGYSTAAKTGGRSSRSNASFEYNPDDMVPRGKHVPQRKSVFTDDEGEVDAEVIGPVDSDDEYQ